MNLRTLKKLSKRAAPLLTLLGDDRRQFPAERGENYTGLVITARKHWERRRSVHPDLWGEHEIKTPAKDGDGWICISPPGHPRKGTIMVGALEGYYEPEWDEKTAWEALRDIVFIEFTDWGEDECSLTRRLDTPSDILRAAESLVATWQREARR
ncbi:hypothetical protein [Brevundimonas nasdae]|uniref:hypothetical protein n=1 Tax=Brevundimonas nasdae TaxID=172043 RepID=UPI003F6934F7